MKQRFMRLAVLGLSVTTIGGMSVTAFAAEPTGEEAQSITIEAPAENVETPEVMLTTVEGDAVTTAEAPVEGDAVTTAETPVEGDVVTTPEETAEVTAPIAEVLADETADGETSVDGEGEENSNENMGEDATGSGEENAGAEDGTEDGTGSGSGNENTGEGDGSGEDGSGEDGSGEDGSGEDGGDVVETGTASVEVSGLEFDGSSDVVMTVKYVGTKTPVNVDFYSNIIQINGHPFSVYTVEETSDGAVVRLSKDELASSWYEMEYGKTYSFTLEDYAMDVQFEDGSWESVPVNGTFTLTYLVGGNTDGGDEGEGGNTGEKPDGGDNTGDGSEEGGDNTGDGGNTGEGGDNTGDGSEDGDNTGDGSEDGDNTGDGSDNGDNTGDNGTTGDNGNAGDNGNDANGGAGNGDKGNNNAGDNSNANGNNQQTVVRSTNSAPQTGDVTAVMPYVGGMLSSMAIAIGAFLKKFRK